MKKYKVSVDYLKDKTFSYQYKLEVGASNQNVAFDILKGQGLCKKIIKDTQRVLLEQNRILA